MCNFTMFEAGTILDFYNFTFRSVTKKAAIGYTYDDSTPAAEENEEDDDEDDSSSDEEIDLGWIRAYFINIMNHSNHVWFGMFC